MDYYGSYGLGEGTDPFLVLFFIVFTIILGSILFRFIQSTKQWNYNNNQPMLDVNCKVVSKRIDVSRYNHSNNGHNTVNSTTSYYVTFEFESCDRLEFTVDGKEYGMLVEGDIGVLKFQGTRYLGFTRK